ncbi:TPA: hypothetical protein QEM49_001358 [Pseudomonas putida]|uniref:hypothetical protein n=1 Tax=Pseudomonas putida TaxID=303 RepID=UPI0023639DCD|nr:hypothetical protein [Pseudomonas putida]MDD2010290.1 hypothetical protein [Pseudomonas putida]HDS1776876.1 hypothetical protein [Pseudomonas putida]
MELELPTHLGRIPFTHLQAENIVSTLKLLAETHNGELPLPACEMLTAEQVKKALCITSFTLRTCIQHEIINCYPGLWRKQLFYPLDIQIFQNKYQSLKSIARSLNWNLHHTARLITHLKITPAFNLSHPPGQWILHKRDADRLLHQATHNHSQPRLPPLVLPSCTVDKKVAKNYLTLSSAAAKLKIKPHDVHCAILYNLMKGACRSGARIFIPLKEIERFSRNYISLNEAAKQLNIASAITLDILWSLEIYPVMKWNAALCKKYHTTLFNRSSVARLYNCEYRDRNSGTFCYYSTTGASRKLGMSTHTLTVLAQHNLISCLRGRNGNYFKIDELDNFQRKYITLNSILRMQHIQAAQASPAAKILQTHCLTPISISTDRDTIYLYERKIYCDRFQKPDSALADTLADLRASIGDHHSRRKVSTPRNDYVSISSAATVHGMTARDYSRTLVRPNNIPVKRFNKILYILDSDRIKCDKLIEKHLTINKCDEFFGYTCTRSLVKSNVLTPSLILPGRKKSLRLIARQDVRQLITALVYYASFPPCKDLGAALADQTKQPFASQA